MSCLPTATSASGSRIFDIGLVCSDSVPAKTSQWLATLARTRTRTETPRIIVHVYFVCALILLLFFVTTRRMRNVWQVQCDPTLPLLLLPLMHSRLISFMHKRCQLCLQMQQSRRGCLFICLPRALFSTAELLVGRGMEPERSYKAFPVSELSLTAHSSHRHTRTRAAMHMWQVQWDKKNKKQKEREAKRRI